MLPLKLFFSSKMKREYFAVWPFRRASLIMNCVFPTNLCFFLFFLSTSTISRTRDFRGTAESLAKMSLVKSNLGNLKPWISSLYSTCYSYWIKVVDAPRTSSFSFRRSAFSFVFGPLSLNLAATSNRIFWSESPFSSLAFMRTSNSWPLS